MLLILCVLVILIHKFCCLSLVFFACFFKSILYFCRDFNTQHNEKTNIAFSIYRRI